MNKVYKIYLKKPLFIAYNSLFLENSLGIRNV